MRTPRFARIRPYAVGAVALVAVALVAVALVAMVNACSSAGSPGSVTEASTVLGNETTEGRSLTEPTTDEPTPSTSAATATSSAAEASTVTTEDADVGCRRFADFGPDEADRWIVVNDGVMGGRSYGSIELTDSLLRFTGRVVTEGGGFTSVRLPLDDAELAGSTRVRLRVRADDRTYGLTLEDDSAVDRRPVSYRADLDIEGPGDDGWVTTELRFADLRPAIFGQPVDAAPFDPDQGREFGVIIADGRDGDFALEVDWIDACP